MDRYIHHRVYSVRVARDGKMSEIQYALVTLPSLPFHAGFPRAPKSRGDTNVFNPHSRPRRHRQSWHRRPA